MKKEIFVLSVIAMGVIQTSGAAVMIFQPNNTSTYTLMNTTNASNGSSSHNIYSTGSGVYKSSNEEIAQAIDDLSAIAKQRKYKQASLKDSRLKYDTTVVAHQDSLADMKRWAEQGNAEYQIKVGAIYYDGQGVRQDLVLARKMFQKAAKQGDIQGQAALGMFYEDGLGGLKRNRAIAKEWYGKTCDQGSQYGCDQYRRLNEQGY